MLVCDRVMTYQHREGVTGHNTVGVTLVTRCSPVTGHGIGGRYEAAVSQTVSRARNAPVSPQHYYPSGNPDGYFRHVANIARSKGRFCESRRRSGTVPA